MYTVRRRFDLFVHITPAFMYIQYTTLAIVFLMGHHTLAEIFIGNVTPWAEIFKKHHVWGGNLQGDITHGAKSSSGITPVVEIFKGALPLGWTSSWGIRPGADIFMGHHAWRGNLQVAITPGAEIFKGPSRLGRKSSRGITPGADILMGMTPHRVGQHLKKW